MGSEFDAVHDLFQLLTRLDGASQDKTVGELLAGCRRVVAIALALHFRTNERRVAQIDGDAVTIQNYQSITSAHRHARLVEAASIHTGPHGPLL
jgi:hypothetical protein